jgi:Flp pilus assembly protein TadG
MGRMKGLLRRLKANQRGLAAVEFVLLAPALLMLAFAVVIYSIYFSAKMGVREAAVEGARAAVAGLSASERATLAQARAQQVVSSYASLLGGSPATINTTSLGSDGFSVTVSCDMSGSPIMRYGSFVPLPSPNVTATATVNNGSY